MTTEPPTKESHVPFWRRSTPDAAPGTSVAVGDRTVATYARVLDGAHVWLDVESTTGGTLAFGSPDGSVIAVDGAAIGAHDATALVVDLTTLPGDGDGEFPVRCLGADGSSWPVHLGDAALGARTATPTTPDGRFRFRVGADEAGDLRLCRTTVPPAARVRRVDQVEGGLEVCWSSPARHRVSSSATRAEPSCPRSTASGSTETGARP